MAERMKLGDRGFTLTRRSLLAGSVGGTLVMAFGGAGMVASAAEAVEKKRFSPTVWFVMDGDGHVRVHIAKAEMGQHVGTALARVVADELEADWDKVSIVHVDSDPKWGYMVTGGSWSVFTTFKSLSQAGAAGRTVMLEAGAALLGAPVGECRAEAGRVIHGSNSISYGRIVQNGDIDRQFTAEELEAMPVKSPDQRRYIGQPSTALDVPEKSLGTAVYGIDAEREGMVYARPLIPPTRYGSTVNGVDDSAAREVKGYLGHQVLKDPSGHLQGWVVALGETFWAAKKAADALEVDWTPGPTAGVDEDQIFTRGKELSRADDGPRFVDHGDFDQAAAQAETLMERFYRSGTALHFALEPANAVAEEVDGTWHIWCGNQWQSLIIPVLAKALGVEESSVVLHQHHLGGGFGRRLWGDYTLPAALTAQAIGKPVKLVLTREDDSRLDCVRSPAVQRFQAAIGKDGTLAGIQHDVVAGWPTKAMAGGFMLDGLDGSGKIDPFAANGADHWYSLPAHRVRCINNDLAQETFLPGWLRAVGAGWIGWGVECFMDELAAQAGVDPIEFRLAMLDADGKNAGEAPQSVGGANRLANVLRRVKVQSGWGRDLPDGEGMGVATCFGQERNMPTWIACVAHVR
ncbi:MAG: molybdopterin-dependent oxidoreductase, partial [Gammaproteobacteria bacterium]